MRKGEPGGMGKGAKDLEETKKGIRRRRRKEIEDWNKRRVREKNRKGSTNDRLIYKICGRIRVPNGVRKLKTIRKLTVESDRGTLCHSQ